VACRRGFFLPVRVLSRLFRRLFCDKLAAAHQAGALQFFAEHAALAQADAFAAWLRPLRRSDWVVYAKRPFAGPQAVLAYLSRLHPPRGHRNSRLITVDDQGVTCKRKDYRAKGRCRYGHMTLTVAEFMRRFLLHVLPHGFHRIRHYGLLAMLRAWSIWHGPVLCCSPSHLRCWQSPTGMPTTPALLPAPSIGITVRAAVPPWW